LQAAGTAPDVVKIMKVVSSETPDYIVLNSIEIMRDTRNAVIIDGTVKNKGYNSEVLLLEYSIKLKNSGVFNRIEPYEGRSEDARGNSYQFELICIL